MHVDDVSILALVCMKWKCHTMLRLKIPRANPTPQTLAHNDQHGGMNFILHEKIKFTNMLSPTGLETNFSMCQLS
jgi:hypothetical protein